MKRSSHKCGASPSPKCQLIERDINPVQSVFSFSQVSSQSTDGEPHHFSGISTPSPSSQLFTENFQEEPPDAPDSDIETNPFRRCTSDSDISLPLSGLSDWDNSSSTSLENPCPTFKWQKFDDILLEHIAEEGIQSAAKTIYKNVDLRKELTKMIFKESHETFKASLRTSIMTSKNNTEWLEIPNKNVGVVTLIFFYKKNLIRN